MTKPTPAQLASKIEGLELRRMTRRTRERLEIPGLVDVLLLPGVTVAELEQKINLIYGSDEQLSSAITEGRPAGVSSTPGRAAADLPAGPVGDDKPRQSRGQAAIRRVEREQRRRRMQGKWVTSR